MLGIIISVSLGWAIGWVIGWALGSFIEAYILKSPRRKLKAEIEALIHENRHRHPAIILNKVQEHLK